MPVRYFDFTCCSANASISASERKRKNFHYCAYACVIVFALMLASLVKTRLKACMRTGGDQRLENDKNI